MPADDNPQAVSFPDLPWELRWELIKESVAASGFTMEQVARRSGLTSVATAKTTRFPAAQEAIASVLGVSPAALFPERYSVEWSVALQLEVERALPGLRGENVANRIRADREAASFEYWRSIPVALGDVPYDQAERLRWVKEQLRARGFRIVDLAQGLAVKRSAINNLAVVWYSDIQARLAEFLGVPPQAIWPERYSTTGEPLATGKAALAMPNTQAVPYQLDLTAGLWLPATALEGLPGLPVTKDMIMARARASGWRTRQHAGVDEVAFASLPAVTKLFLTGTEVGQPGSDPAGDRQRRLGMNAQIACNDHPVQNFDQTVQVSVCGASAHLSLVKVDPRVNRIEDLTSVEMSPSELRAAATALIEAAQMLEVGR
ncbi:TPA: helix-turn-helix domain-containing protein [Pseudomonas aeruginosa]